MAEPITTENIEAIITPIIEKIVEKVVGEVVGTLLNDMMTLIDERFNKLEAQMERMDKRVTYVEKHLSRKRNFPQLKLRPES